MLCNRQNIPRQLVLRQLPVKCDPKRNHPGFRTMKPRVSGVLCPIRNTCSHAKYINACSYQHSWRQHIPDTTKLSHKYFPVAQFIFCSLKDTNAFALLSIVRVLLWHFSCQCVFVCDYFLHSNSFSCSRTTPDNVGTLKNQVYCQTFFEEGERERPIMHASADSLMHSIATVWFVRQCVSTLPLLTLSSYLQNKQGRRRVGLRHTRQTRGKSTSTHTDEHGRIGT